MEIWEIHKYVEIKLCTPNNQWVKEEKLENTLTWVKMKTQYSTMYKIQLKQCLAINAYIEKRRKISNQ